MPNHPGRTITATDLKRIRAALAAKYNAQKDAPTKFFAARLRALVLLTIGSGLRLSESLALEIGQVIEGNPDNRWRIRGVSFLKATQAKRKRPRRFFLPESSRQALLSYLRTGIEQQVFTEPLELADHLFVAGKGNRATTITPRNIQTSWQRFQRSIGIAQSYRWHDLRHTAASLFAAQAENPWQVRDYLGVKSLETAGIYIHTDDNLLAVAEKMTNDKQTNKQTTKISPKQTKT